MSQLDDFIEAQRKAGKVFSREILTSKLNGDPIGTTVKVAKGDGTFEDHHFDKKGDGVKDPQELESMTPKEAEKLHDDVITDSETPPTVT